MVRKNVRLKLKRRLNKVRRRVGDAMLSTGTQFNRALEAFLAAGVERKLMVELQEITRDFTPEQMNHFVSVVRSLIAFNAPETSADSKPVTKH